MDKVISLKNISKAYQLGVFNTGSFGSDIKRWWALKRGQEDPFLKIGEENDRSSKGKSNIVWSLRDISFDVKRGECVGLIGRNGAGKSTLLKILSQVTQATSGQLKMKGKVASLLEVGTGFHPELTGRENIFLNGAILGMRHHEIKSKFDEIVNFSGVERYIDTPVKRYSSGMYVRLAFAVAAHLDSDILIIDEVLAVGDVAFQKKCISKMNQIGKSEGRTIIFVSHNMSAIRNLCSSVVVFEKGKKVFQGETNEGVKNYIGYNDDDQEKMAKWQPENGDVSGNNLCQIKSVSLLNQKGERTCNFDISKAIKIELEYVILDNSFQAMFSLVLFDDEGNCVFGSINNLEPNYFGKNMREGYYKSICEIPGNLLNDGAYSISIIGMSTSRTDAFTLEHILQFDMHDDGLLKKGYDGNYGGIIRPKLDWKTERIN